MPTKLLVVDDEPDLELLIRQKFRKQIREKDFEFVFAHNGVEALEKLRADREIDIVLSDINMPEMDGLTLLSELKEFGPVLKAVIVSAYGDMENIRTAMNRGAFDFLTKPIDFRDLEVTVDKTLRELMTLKEALVAHSQLVSIQQELKVASYIQHSILPRTFPPFPGRRDFDLNAQMIPAKEVGGDFYDFFLIDQERLGFVIGDVSGKGVPAAIFMAMSRSFLKMTALKGVSPSDCLQDVNRALCSENESSMFVSIFYGILHTRSGEVEYSVGGHFPPYRLRLTGGAEAVETTGGIVLGAIESARYECKRILLQPGEGLVLYTDGVTGAMDENENLFSEHRLKELLEAAKHASPEDLIRGLVREVRAFSAGTPQSDDITVLALRYLGQ